MATVFLCSWDALHLNVPADDDSDLMQVLRQVKWMTIAILAPELIAVHALREWYETRWLYRQVLEIVHSQACDLYASR